MKLKMDEFYLKLADNYFNKGDILISNDGVKCKTLETPHKKWWKQILQFITFGLYKAPTQYKCKIIHLVVSIPPYRAS